jgi:hypothetical protein
VKLAVKETALTALVLTVIVLTVIAKNQYKNSGVKADHSKGIDKVKS